MCYVKNFFIRALRLLRQIAITILKILIVLLPVMLLWLYNNYKNNQSLLNNLQAQTNFQLTWQKENITAWTCGAVNTTNTVVVITPEYYEDFYTPERMATYNIDNRANYVLTAFNRNFSDPFEVAKDISTLVKELRANYSNIIIAGHSKGTTISIAMLNYLSDTDYDMIINISATYNGTPLAMPEKMSEILKPKKIFNFEYGTAILDFYLDTFDGDQADQIIREDSLFLQQLDYSKINENKFINITAKSGFVSFFYDLWNFDPEGLALPFLDSILSLDGDGIVSLDSQESKIGSDVKTIPIKASHKSSYKVGLATVFKNLFN